VDARGDLLTTEEVMDRLLSDRRLRRLAATCVLPAIRDGGEWRFRKSDLDAWVAVQIAVFDKRQQGQAYSDGEDDDGA
jgi:excisionase family DNA binding protein